MIRHIMLNGEIMPANIPCISHDNRGIRYGDCFTVVMRGNSSLAFFEDEYFDFMLELLKEKKFVIPQIFVKQIFYNDLHLILQKNRIYKGFIAYMTFFKNNSSSIKNNSTSILIVPEAIENEYYNFIEKGISIDYLHNFFVEDLFFKKIFYGIIRNQLFYIEDFSNIKCDDFLLTDKNNNIIKTTKSAIFFVKEDTIYYPENIPDDQDKVFSFIIIALAQAVGIKTIKQNIKYSDIKNFDEIFTADLINGIQYVSALQEFRFYRKTSLKLSNSLNLFLKKYIQEKIKS